MHQAASTPPAVSSGISIYRPLDRAHQSIRLLAITVKANGNLSNHLKQDVRLHTLKCPKYIALSYTWGPPNPAQEIEVDKKIMTISQNLYDFLQQFCPDLFYHDCSSQGPVTYFWIDQICIDQNSSVEKNHQVAMMADI